MPRLSSPLSQPFNSPAQVPGTRWLIALLGVVLLLGAGLRVQRYLLAIPFWRDEAFIVINVRDLSPGQLFGPLRYDQAAPPGFLLLQHGMARVFGSGELSLRAIPLLCGIAAMGVVAVLAWRLFGLPAAIFAGGLMAFCQKLIEYSTEVKQYSGDVCAAAILLSAALSPARPAMVRLWRVAMIAAIAVWFSHTSALMFAGISAVLSIAAWRDDRGNLPAIAAAIALVAGSFILLYRCSIRFEHTGFLYSYWQDSFPDWAHPGTLLPWLIHQTSQWMNEPYHAVGGVLAILAVISLPMMVRNRRAEIWLIGAAPLVVTLLASCLRQYPYNGSRLTLFSLPGFFLLAAAGAEMIRVQLPTRMRILGCVLPISILAYGLAWGVIRAAHPQYHSYIRPAIAYLREHRRDDEPIYCLGEPEVNDLDAILKGRNVEILCYWPDPPGKVQTVVRSFDEISEPRFWILMPFHPQDGPAMVRKTLRRLDRSDRQIDPFIDPRGGAAILFDRSRP